MLFRSGVPGLGFQEIPAGATSSWKDFVVAVDPERCGIDRDGLRARLAERGIETRAYYSPAAHAMEAFRGFLGPHRRLPVTERLAATLVALPMGVHVTPAVAGAVAGAVEISDAVSSVLAERRAAAAGEFG